MGYTVVALKVPLNDFLYLTTVELLHPNHYQIEQKKQFLYTEANSNFNEPDTFLIVFNWAAEPTRLTDSPALNSRTYAFIKQLRF